MLAEETAAYTMTDPAFFYVLTERLDLLAIDDDPIMREFASVYLASPTATVHTAENGAAGLKMLAERRFDIILLDIDMPGLTGFDVLERLRANPDTAGLPVIVITSREDIPSIDRAYQLGATSFVSKPVNWRMLAYQVRYVHRASRAVSDAAQTERAAA